MACSWGHLGYRYDLAFVAVGSGADEDIAGVTVGVAMLFAGWNAGDFFFAGFGVEFLLIFDHLGLDEI